MAARSCASSFSSQYRRRDELALFVVVLLLLPMLIAGDAASAERDDEEWFGERGECEEREARERERDEGRTDDRLPPVALLLLLLSSSASLLLQPRPTLGALPGRVLPGDPPISAGEGSEDTRDDDGLLDAAATKILDIVLFILMRRSCSSSQP